MGCGSSKAVAPAPVEEPGKDSVQSLAGGAAAPAAAPAPEATAGGTPESGSPLRAAPDHDGAGQHNHGTHHIVHDMSLPGRIDSVTAPMPPPPGTDSQPAAAGGSSLLSRQPDWLGQLQADPSSGAVPPPRPAPGVACGSLSTPAGHMPSLAAPASKASSLPPLVPLGRAGPLSGSLPPILHGSAAKQALPGLGASGTPPAHAELQAAAAAAAVAASQEGALPVMSRETSTRQRASNACSSPDLSTAGTGDAGLPGKEHNVNQGSRRGSQSSSPAPAAAPGAACADPWSALQDQYAAAASSPSPDNSMAGGAARAALPPLAPPAAATGGAAAVRSLPPLQQHGAGPAAAQMAGTGAGPHGAAHGASAAAGQAGGAQRELVLEDDSDAEEERAHGQGGQLGKQQQQQERATTGPVHVHSSTEQQGLAPHSSRGPSDSGIMHPRGSDSASSGGSSADARLAISEASGGPLGPHTHTAAAAAAAGTPVKAGGWGAGSFAGAGTIMLGSKPPPAVQAADGAPAAGHGKPAGAAPPRDDVFGDDDDDDGGQALHGAPHGGAAAAAAEGSSRGLSASHSRLPQPEEEEVMGLEEIEDDVDAMIASEMATASRDGLPADLAAKLARLDALGGAGGDGDGGSDAGGGGSGSGRSSPSVFALMNKQGSWRVS